MNRPCKAQGEAVRIEDMLLSNGVALPSIGLGTWQITKPELLAELVACAYDAGYRLLDTAAAYGNEIALAKALRSTGIPRDKLLLSDKVWNTSRGYQAVQEACRKSLKKLKTDFLDLYLIHWPAGSKLHPDWAELNAETWRGMEALYQEGLVRAIGVCNFKQHHLQELKKTAAILPLVNQFEFHPGMNQEELLRYCQQNQIQPQASSPLGNGQILAQEELCKIAAERKKTPAQICLRWALQKGVAVLPKTANPRRLYENADVFDFALSAAEMQRIDQLPYCGGLGLDADEVTTFG